MNTMAHYILYSDLLSDRPTFERFCTHVGRVYRRVSGGRLFSKGFQTR